MSDVLKGRGGAGSDDEERKEEPVPGIDPALLNDIRLGEFRIEAMKMKDAEAGSILWESNQWDLTSNEEQKVQFPAAMLGCRAIGREIVFYSKKVMQEFSIRQIMSLHGQVVEEFGFDFGFVMPNTTNSWE